jgi:uncharacterized membrane protein YcaP (DUF421 family)
VDRGRIFFDGWTGVASSFLLAALGYVALLLLIRFSGKRTIAKMNVFDFIIVVALGSTLGNTALSSSIVLLEGIAAFLALIGLQFAFSVLTMRSERLNQLINGEPALLARGGTLLRGAMRKERVTEEEALAALRAAGVADVAEVEALVLETDGTFSVIRRHEEARYTSLADVSEYPVGSAPESGHAPPAGSATGDEQSPPGGTANRHP